MLFRNSAVDKSPQALIARMIPLIINLVFAQYILLLYKSTTPNCLSYTYCAFCVGNNIFPCCYESLSGNEVVNITEGHSHKRTDGRQDCTISRQPG